MTAAAPSGRRAAAVLFDMDGVLVDSEPIWYDAETALAAELGGTWSPAHQQQILGGTLRGGCEYIARVTGSERPIEELMAALLDHMHERYLIGVPTLPGALECVDAVRAAGIPTALVTSTYRRLLDAALAGLGAQRFDVTVAGDEVAAGKPDPAPYLAACERLGVDPADCVVVEDAPNGVASGEAAGSVVLAVPSTMPIPAGPRRVVVDSLSRVDVDWLLALPAATGVGGA